MFTGIMKALDGGQSTLKSYLTFRALEAGDIDQIFKLLKQEVQLAEHRLFETIGTGIGHAMKPQSNSLADILMSIGSKGACGGMVEINSPEDWEKVLSMLAELSQCKTNKANRSSGN